MPDQTTITARKIWDLGAVEAADGPSTHGIRDLRGEIHPDLIRYRGYWYCGLKEGHGPASSPYTCSRIIRSQDGTHWESVKRFTHAAGKVSDLKFSITGEGALMVATNIQNPGVSRGYGNHHASANRIWSATWLTWDGVDWGTVHTCPTGINTVRYSVTWHQGLGYSISGGKGTPTGTLFRSGDGKSWHPLAEHIFLPWLAKRPSAGGHDAAADPHDYTQRRNEPNVIPTEAALVFAPDDGTAWAIVRTHPVFAIIGKAAGPDYQNWSWQEAHVDWAGDGKLQPAWQRAGVQFGGPTMQVLSNGIILVAGRADASTPGKPEGRVTLFILDRETAVLRKWQALQGFSHYPGIVEHEGELWISCGRQQGQDPFEVWLLRLPIPQP